MFDTDILKMVIIVWLVTVIITASLTESVCLNIPINVLVNTKLRRFSFGSLKARSLSSCAWKCLSFTKCKSFDYQTAALVEYPCKLNIRNRTTVTESYFREVRGSVFSDISTWPVEIAGSCGQRPCHQKQICLPTGSTYVCKTIDCGKPPNIMNGFTDTPKTTLGSRLYVTCLSGYRHISNNTYLRCTASGEWSTPSPKCIE